MKVLAERRFLYTTEAGAAPGRASWRGVAGGVARPRCGLRLCFVLSLDLYHIFKGPPDNNVVRVKFHIYSSKAAGL